MRRHVLDGREGRRVVSRLRGVIVFVDPSLILAASLRRATALEFPRRRHAVRRGGATSHLLI